MKRYRISVLAAATLLLMGCNSGKPLSPQPQQNKVQASALPGYTDKTYTRDDTTILSNPERGLIWDGARKGRRTSYTVWDPTSLITLNPGQTLLRFDLGLKPCRQLDTFSSALADNDPSNDECFYLVHNLNNWFANVRSKGLKLVVLPLYMYSDNTDPTAEYDPPLARVLGHIAQLTPVFQANEDVIAYVHLGFIGYWGEMWAHPFPGDTSSQTTLIQTANFLQILGAVQNMVPNRFVLVRFPDFLKKISPAPVTADQAFGPSSIARTGFYNSCILGGVTSGSTVHTDCNTYTGDAAEQQAERRYVIEQGLYTPVGGETWEYGFSAPNLSYASIVATLEQQHWSYLRNFSSTAISQLSSFRSGKITLQDTLNRRLGYRLSLRSASLPNAVTRGQSHGVSLVLENTGFAAPMNPRKVQLVLSNASHTQRIDLPTLDPRRWLAAQQHVVNITVTIPSTMPRGTYAAYLALPAPESRIAGDSRYAIRLANSGSTFWNNTLGANNLSHSIAVN